MTEIETLVFRVLERVSLHGPLQHEELGKLLPVYTCNQIILAADRIGIERRREMRHLDCRNHSYHM